MENSVIYSVDTIAIGFPSFNRSAIGVRTESKDSITRLTDADTVSVGDWLRNGNGRGRIGGVPEIEEELLGNDHVWMATSFDLWWRPVELVDLWIIRWEAYFCQIC